MNERSRINRRELLATDMVLPLTALPATARGATPSCGPTPTAATRIPPT